MSKLSRICSGAINLARATPSLVLAERHYGPMAASLDRGEIARIVREFKLQPDFADGRKYLRYSLYLRDNLARCVALGLDASPPLRVLDLGSGAGYFLACCKYFGHEGEGFDLPGNAFYRKMFAAMALERTEGMIQPFAPLRGPNGTFDLVTAYAVTFSKANRQPGAKEWGRDEWQFFLADLIRFLRPGARVLLRLNIGEIAGLRGSEYRHFLEPPAGYAAEVLDRREIVFHRIVTTPGA